MNKFDINEACFLSNVARYVTEQSAIAAKGLFGKGNKELADKAAVDIMRTCLNQFDIDSTVVIGEGEMDEAPMLYIGETIGTKVGPKIDIAVDPLDGTKILASGSDNALSVIAIAPHGTLLHAPDIYMEKIAIGFDFPEQIIDLDNSVTENLKNVAKAKKCEINELVVCILDRSRHEEAIARIREAGSRIRLIQDGDIAAVIATTKPDLHVDIYYGTGGAPEGVLAAAALKCSSGQICAKLQFKNVEQKDRAHTMGINDISRKYYLNDMVASNVIFSATGVTNGYLLPGVTKKDNHYITHSLVMSDCPTKISSIIKSTFTL